MAYTFSRRNFLKTGAAAALLGGMSVLLTGCDSNDGAPAFSKKVGDNTYNVGGVTIDLETDPSLNPENQAYSIDLEIKNNSSTPAIIYRDSFSASYKGNLLHLISFTNDNETPSKEANSISLEPNTPVDVSVTFTGATGATAQDLKDFVFKFHYNDKSIKFKEDTDGKTILTTGVYTDKITL